MTTITARLRPSAPAYYGWRIVGYAALCLAMTAPGQTVGVSSYRGDKSWVRPVAEGYRSHR